jgi:hypothetical protein
MCTRPANANGARSRGGDGGTNECAGTGWHRCRQSNQSAARNAPLRVAPVPTILFPLGSIDPAHTRAAKSDEGDGSASPPARNTIIGDGRKVPTQETST